MSINQLSFSGSGFLVQRPGKYYGFSVAEESGSAGAKIKIYDSSSASGKILDVVTLAANESAREFYSIDVQVDTGIYVQVVSGSVAGSVRFL
jgi:hypothetical protein